MLQVYTGNGKGKTTAALGLAFRAAGYGLRTVMFSFLKGDPSYGEAQAAPLLPGFSLYQVGRDSFVNFQSPDPEDLRLCQAGWQRAQAAIAGREADLFILDELNIALYGGLLPLEQVCGFLQEQKGRCEIICTGRYAPAPLLAIADLVTEMQEVRHYFHKGIDARDGIDH